MLDRQRNPLKNSISSETSLKHQSRKQFRNTIFCSPPKPQKQKQFQTKASIIRCFSHANEVWEEGFKESKEKKENKAINFQILD